MLPRNDDLHGNAPDTSPVALLLIDVINDLEFEGGTRLLANALPAAQHIATLKQRARRAQIPVIYANDNFGRWRSDFRQVVQHCLHDQVRGEPLARLLTPDDEDYFVLKPKHSAFFATTLAFLLHYLGVQRLILTGFTGDNCVLFTANDAHMHDLCLHVPRDCVASICPEDNRHALRFMERVLKADLTSSARVDLEALKSSSDTAG
jgi:nicotinamidase-related amidase